ncbi:hypothetical protein Peur_069356 [Populus x canadensis]
MVARLSLYQHHPIITTVFSVLIILVSTSYGDDDKDYTDCEKPFNCGLLPELSYPFWGGDRPEVCGHKGFELKCEDGQLPIIASDTVGFRLLNLNQSSRLMTLQLVNFEDYICPTQIRTNSSSGSDIHIFGYDLSLENLNLLYNCSISGSEALSKNRISFCNGYTGSSFYGNDILVSSSGLDVMQCSMRIRIPIAKSFGELLVGDRPELEEVLGDRFNVSYQYDQGTSLNVGRKVAIALGASLGTLVTMLIAFFFWYRRKKRQYESIFSRSIKSVPSSKAHTEKRSSYNGAHLFSYEELEEATNNFDKTRELGVGGFGTVYYGKLPDGLEVAVKRSYENNYKRLEQFLNEVDILTRLRHQNLVLLHGCTSRDSRELLLVYQYIPNGTLADHLHGEKAKPGALPCLGFESDYAARKMIRAVAELAFQCLQNAKELRPSMEKVLEILKEIQSRDYNAEKAEDINSPSDDDGLFAFT